MRGSGVLVGLSCAMLLVAIAPAPGVRAVASAEIEATKSDRLVTIRDYKGRLALQPNGPFAAAIFREDALGDYIGIIYWRAMGDPVAGKWRLEDRFWQTSEWSADVTSFAWAPSGKYLYVATGGMYGTGYVYRLDLSGRSAQVIFPPKSDLERASQGGDFESKIIGFDASRKVLKLQFSSSDLPKPLVKEVPFE
jgi:hypothetical protein